MSDNTVTTCPATGKPIQVTLVGDGTVGKMCLVNTHTTGTFPMEYVPTVFDIIEHEETVDGTTYCLTLLLTAGQEEYERLRSLSYPTTSVFIICFSLNSRASFVNVSRKWLPEVRAHCPKVPVLLVGTKKDVRDEAVISPKDGHRLCRKEGLVQYLECSAKTKEGLTEVFQVTAKASVGVAGLFKKKSQMCCIL